MFDGEATAPSPQLVYGPNSAGKSNLSLGAGWRNASLCRSSSPPPGCGRRCHAAGGPSPSCPGRWPRLRPPARP